VSTNPFPLVFTDNPGSLPAQYVLAPGEAIAIEAVRAKIDGTSASGTFYPCLAIYSQDGKLIARVPTSTAYNAGDTGEVTWSPFLRQQSRQSSAGQVPWCYAQWSASNFTGASGNASDTALTYQVNSDSSIFGDDGFSVTLSKYGAYTFSSVFYLTLEAAPWNRAPVYGGYLSSYYSWGYSLEYFQSRTWVDPTYNAHWSYYWSTTISTTFVLDTGVTLPVSFAPTLNIYPALVAVQASPAYAGATFLYVGDAA